MTVGPDSTTNLGLVESGSTTPAYFILMKLHNPGGGLDELMWNGRSQTEELGVDYQGGCAHLDIEDGWPWNWGLVCIYLLVW